MRMKVVRPLEPDARGEVARAAAEVVAAEWKVEPDRPCGTQTVFSTGRAAADAILERRSAAADEAEPAREPAPRLEPEAPHAPFDGVAAALAAGRELAAKSGARLRDGLHGWIARRPIHAGRARRRNGAREGQRDRETETPETHEG